MKTGDASDGEAPQHKAVQSVAHGARISTWLMHLGKEGEPPKSKSKCWQLHIQCAIMPASCLEILQSISSQWSAYKLAHKLS